jgi:hypothetical protein
VFYAFFWVIRASYLPAYEDGTECSETLPFKLQTHVKHPEESIQLQECSQNCRIKQFVMLSQEHEACDALGSEY